MDKNVEEFTKCFLESTNQAYKQIKEKGEQSDWIVLICLQYAHNLFLNYAKLNGYEGNDVIKTGFSLKKENDIID